MRGKPEVASVVTYIEEEIIDKKTSEVHQLCSWYEG